MDFLRNFLSSIIILLAIPLLLAGTISFIATRTVFSEDFVKRQAEESRLYDGLAGFASASLKDQANNEELEPIIDRAITTERVQNAVEPALSKLFAYLKSQARAVDIAVDLRPIKNDIKSSIPKSQQGGLDELVPDELRVSNPDSQTTQVPSRLGRFKGWYQRLNTWSKFLPLVVLGLLVLLALINHGRSRLRRPAYVFLVVGLILGLVGGIAAIGIPYALRRLGGNPDFPAVVNEAVQNLARSVGGDISRLILIAGGAYLALAILLFIVSFFIHQPLHITTGPDERTYDPKRGTVKR